MQDIRIRNTLPSALFTALLIAGAYIRIPIPPIPITLQTFFLLVGALFIRKWMLLSLLAYLILGALGLQVFANGGGSIAYFLGPTGGFLLAFIPAVACVAWMGGKAQQCLRNTIVLIAATLIIYAGGLAWFMRVQEVSLGVALSTVVLPFLIGDSIKILAAVFIFYTLGPLLHAE